MSTAAVQQRRLRHGVDLIAVLVLRDLRLRYRRSVLGVAWSQLSPLALLAVLTFVFTEILPLSIPRYALFVYVGLLPWTWFSGALTDGANAIVWSRDLVRRPGVPISLLPVTTVLTHACYFALALPVLFAGLLVDGGVPLTALALPAIVTVQFVLLLGPVYLVASLQVDLRDTGHLVGVILVPAFYATPVFYEIGSVPERFRWIYDLNPVNQLIGAYRDALLAGRWPDPVPLAALAAVGVVVAWFGRRVFERSAHRFAEELG